MTNEKTISQLFPEITELDAICAELDLEEIKYLPSPKEQNGNYSELATHATIMLKVYKRYKAGDMTAPIEEIFAED